MRGVSATGALSPVVSLRGSGPRIGTAEKRQVVDSLRLAIEDEMVALRFEEPMKREFRILHETLRNELQLPQSVPVVNRAWLDAGSAQTIAVLENGSPGAAESCISLLSTSGRRLARRCYAFRNRETLAAITTATHVLWFQANDDGDSWMIKTARPDAR